MIHILREPDVDGRRIEDDVDESCLVKTEGVTDNEQEYTTWVEYRFPDSDVVVHRSCHVTLKQGMESFGALQHLDIDAWARSIIDGLVRQRQITGHSVELRGRYTSQEQAALRRVLTANHLTGSVEAV